MLQQIEDCSLSRKQKMNWNRKLQLALNVLNIPPLCVSPKTRDVFISSRQNSETWNLQKLWQLSAVWCNISFFSIQASLILFVGVWMYVSSIPQVSIFCKVNVYFTSLFQGRGQKLICLKNDYLGATFSQQGFLVKFIAQPHRYQEDTVEGTLTQNNS